MSHADSLILAWSGGRSVTKSIAADLARKMQDGRLERWRQLPDSDDLARRWDTSVRTVSRAMKLLADHGFIAKQGNRYHVSGPGTAHFCREPGRRERVSDERG